jgi:hypothetical protein
MSGSIGLVVPDCREPDDRHNPPGTRPAAYWYEWHDVQSGLDLGWVLCVECTARIRALAGQSDLDIFAPPPVRIQVLRDANTQKPVV